MVNFIIALAPLFVVFEIAQIIVAQRYIGIDQIRAGLHPLEVNPRGPALFSALWVLAIFANYAYEISLVFQPRPVMNQVAYLLLAISFLGWGLRRGCGLKYGLVVLTFEGAARAGFLCYMFLALVFFARLIPLPLR